MLLSPIFEFAFSGVDLFVYVPFLIVGVLVFAVVRVPFAFGVDDVRLAALTDPDVKQREEFRVFRAVTVAVFAWFVVDECLRDVVQSRFTAGRV